MGRLRRRQVLVGLPAAAGALALAHAGLAGRSYRPRTLASGTTGKAPLISRPFVSGFDGYTCYRTPALAISAHGTVLAFCGGRVDNCRDEGNIDVILRRSTDGGRSWGPLQVIANDGPHPCKIPLPVVLASGRILLLWLWNASVRRKDDRGRRHVRLTSSDDDGRSWAPTRDITDQVRLAGWTPWYGIGPGHGIVKQRDPAAGRIVVPARHGESARGGASHLLLSDDDGDSWRVGAVASHPSNESSVAELANGSLMLNSRSRGGRRMVSISHDGGLTMATSGPDPTLIEPENGCQASLLSYAVRADGLTTLLFSNPVDPVLRTNGRIQISHDDGRSWQRGYGYASGPGVFTGYSDLARFPGGDVALLFESGADARKAQGEERARNRERLKGRGDNRHDAIEFRRVPFSLISGEGEP